MSIPRIQIYCDGGCRGNQSRTNVGGWGVYLRFGSTEKELYGGAVDTTNNVMELTACLRGLQAIKRPDLGVDVYLDSAYVHKGITEWVHGWIRKGWVNSKKEPVANKELWLALLDEKKRFSDLAFHKVKGHADNAGNIRADALANRAMDEVSRR